MKIIIIKIIIINIIHQNNYSEASKLNAYMTKLIFFRLSFFPSFISTEVLTSSYPSTNTQTFKMFDEAQIKEFKEIFGMIDKNSDGMLQADDLVALYSEDLGKPADEAALGAMIAEAPGPLDFQMLLQLFGEKMSGTDPEETIMAGWHLFDPSASGEMNVDAVKALLCSRGVKADRLTEAEVAQMFDQVKPAAGKFNYGKFTRIMKRGSDE
jgi:Ca2+-binding EF-hand superfamily protein